MLVGLALSCADPSALALYSSNEINLKDVGLVQKLVRDRVGNALRVRQSFEAPRVDDVPGEVDAQLRRLNLAEKVSPGQSVAVTVGSRGIAGIDKIIPIATPSPWR